MSNTASDYRSSKRHSPSSYGGHSGFPQDSSAGFSPPDSDDSDTLSPPIQQKKSWLGGFLSKQQQLEEKQQSDKDKASSLYSSNGPPSPPASVRSSTSTLRMNVNQRSGSFASLSRPSRTLDRRDSYAESRATSPTSSIASSASTITTSTSAPSSSSWSLFSRQSKSKPNKENSAYPDVVSQSFAQKQRRRDTDDLSIMTSDTVLVNPGPPRTPMATPNSSRKLPRNSSVASLSDDGGSYFPNNSNGSTTNLNGYDIYKGTPAGRKLARGEKAMETGSIRTIETIGKPKTVVKKTNAKERPIITPEMMKADLPPMVEDIKKKKKSKKSKENQYSYPNLVTPKLEDCLETEKARGPLWSSLSDKMSKLLSDAKAQNQDSHLRLHITPPKTFRKAVAIGVHGYFPHKMVRSVIGQPTGTSSKFANEAADAIERWATAHGMTDFSVTKIALEHEGIVSDRIENLYRILSKHMRVIQEADYIMIAAHSQGTPVAIQLLAKLIEEGHVDNKTIGILAMAGISLGPFFGLDQKLLMRAYGSIENDSLKELFAFQNPNCLQGRRYMSGLRTVIQHGVKITFVGSVNDQLVPLYSSLCAHVTHPYIYRSIFVDGKIHAPTFIISFIELLVKLRNFGYTDHGILRDISDAMAGTLTGGGHSVIYNEHAVYDLAIRQTLETSELPDIPVAIDEDFEIPTPMNYNPYNLPWSVRGLFEQQFVREQLLDDMNKALEKFDEWDPDTKPLKDVKYRLSAIKSAVLGNGKPGPGMPMPRELANGVVQGAA